MSPSSSSSSSSSSVSVIGLFNGITGGSEASFDQAHLNGQGNGRPAREGWLPASQPASLTLHSLTLCAQNLLNKLSECVCERNQQKEGDAADDNVLVVLVGELGPASEKLSLFYFIFLTVFTHTVCQMTKAIFCFFLAPHYLLTSVVLVLRKFVLKMIIL